MHARGGGLQCERAGPGGHVEQPLARFQPEQPQRVAGEPTAYRRKPLVVIRRAVAPSVRVLIAGDGNRTHDLAPPAWSAGLLASDDGSPPAVGCLLVAPAEGLRLHRPASAIMGASRAKPPVARHLHGAPLLRDGNRRAAVIVERGDPDRLAPLLMAAYELTSREKDVTRLVLRGETTSSIAAGLFVSPHTVQQHLKSIFEKTGVRSRRELVGKVFFAHYEPRVRDNERRAQTGRPFRGGPAVPASADRPASRQARRGQHRDPTGPP